MSLNLNDVSVCDRNWRRFWLTLLQYGGDPPNCSATWENEVGQSSHWYTPNYTVSSHWEKNEDFFFQCEYVQYIAYHGLVVHHHVCVCVFVWMTVGISNPELAPCCPILWPNNLLKTKNRPPLLVPWNSGDVALIYLFSFYHDAVLHLVCYVLYYSYYCVHLEALLPLFNRI